MESVKELLLNNLFYKTEKGVPGECPLPEPGRGAPPVWGSTSLVRVEKQPEGYDYDSSHADIEKEGFIKRLSRLANEDVEVREWLERNIDEIRGGNI